MRAINRSSLFFLLAILPVGLGGQDAPNPSEAQAILNRAHDYADGYINKLPDFLCRQRTDQFQGDKKGRKWKAGDTIDSKLVYAGGREKRTLEAVNGKAPAPGMRRLAWRPLTTEGEFGILLANVVGADSKAEYQWAGWQELNGKRMAEFSYKMARENSTMKLSRSDLATAVIAYQGKFLVDPDDGRVWRISNEAVDIPEDLETRSLVTAIDYRPVTVGASVYLMPSTAVILMATRSNSVRNELTFSGFQKFETGSTITFGGEGGEGQGTPQAPAQTLPPPPE